MDASSEVAKESTDSRATNIKTELVALKLNEDEESNNAVVTMSSLNPLINSEDKENSESKDKAFPTCDDIDKLDSDIKKIDIEQDDHSTQEPVSDDEDSDSDEEEIIISTSYTSQTNNVGLAKRFLTGTNIWVRSNNDGPIDGSKIDGSPARGGQSSNNDSRGNQRLDSDGYPFIEDLQRTYNRTAFDVRMDDLEEAPWRRPGVDLSDYFNYGFTEQTWREYAKVQLRLRYDKESRRSREMFGSKQSSGNEDMSTRKSIHSASGQSKTGMQQRDDRSYSPLPPSTFSSNQYQGSMITGRGSWSGQPKGTISRNSWDPRNSSFGPSAWQGGLKGSWSRSRRNEERRDADKESEFETKRGTSREQSREKKSGIKMRKSKDDVLTAESRVESTTKDESADKNATMDKKKEVSSKKNVSKERLSRGNESKEEVIRKGGINEKNARKREIKEKSTRKDESRDSPLKKVESKEKNIRKGGSRDRCLPKVESKESISRKDSSKDKYTHKDHFKDRNARKPSSTDKEQRKNEMNERSSNKEYRKDRSSRKDGSGEKRTKESKDTVPERIKKMPKDKSSNKNQEGQHDRSVRDSPRESTSTRGTVENKKIGEKKSDGSRGSIKTSHSGKDGAESRGREGEKQQSRKRNRESPKGNREKKDGNKNWNEVSNSEVRKKSKKDRELYSKSNDRAGNRRS